MDYTALYGEHANKSAQDERYAKLADKFKKREGKSHDVFISSPGRAEVLGNHTDHNHGKVIVGAISCDILAAVSKNDENAIKICSEGYRDIRVDLNDLELKEREYGTSAALTRGVARALKNRGYGFGGFTAHITSNVFKGAGVSSSAAFELLIAECLNCLYLDGKAAAIEKAVAAQYAENVYFNKPCGLLDQSGIALGSLHKLDFLIPEKPAVQKLTAPKGYTLVITNTGGDHSDLTEHYAAIKEEMHAVSKFFGKEFLREVNEEDFYGSLKELTKKFSGRALLRAIHFFDENKNVDRAAQALERGDAREFLNCVNASGESSLRCLQNNYVPGDVRQVIPLAIKYSEKIIKDGAVRIHGGGFAGTILAFVSDGEADGYVEQMRALYGRDNVFKAYIREKGTCEVK